MIRPEIGLSNVYLNLSVETGSSLEGSFMIYSKNGQELEGKVFSTNDKVVVRNADLSGTECEISYYFKGKMAIAGEEHAGDFLLLTNGGEYNIPYRVSVVQKKYWFGDREIANLNDFYELAKEDWKKARDIFFTKEFPNILLAQHEEEQILYHDLLKGYSKDRIMDHFLMETMGKEPARLEIMEQEIVIDETKVGRLMLKGKGWGCLEGNISSERGSLLFNKERFHMEDFHDNSMDLFLSFREGCQKDVLVIESGLEQIKIPVRCKRTNLEEKSRVRGNQKAYAALLRSYVSFRTGKITEEEYVETSLKALVPKDNFCELYCLLLLLIQGTTEETAVEERDSFAAHLEEKKSRYLEDPKVRSFYYYVMALWRKDPAFTKEAAAFIRKELEKSGALEDFILLLFLDETLAFSEKEQESTLLTYLEQGENSPLFYLAYLDLLNQEPYLLEHFGEKKADVIRWGVKHQYLSRKLMEQFASLALREKNFRKKELDLLIYFYDKNPEVLCLKAICSLLMKGNKTDLCYHRFFAEAVAQNLNLIGINEFYLRTLDFEADPLISKIVLYYFHYSNSLDRREKAWLYVNIWNHREEYGEIFQNYKPRMEEFVKEQLTEGKINRYVKQLYERMLPSLLEEKEWAKYLPNVIFKKKMICHNPVMEGIYVCHPENEEEVFVPLVDGECQLEIYSVNARIYFADRMGNRYHCGISYSLEHYLEEENYRKDCLEYCNDNRKVFVRWLKLEEEDKKEVLSRLLLQKEETNSWRREKAVEQILDYHYEERAMEDLSECLDQINYRIISPAYRRTLMNYYMACDRMEDAYFGVELYGSDLMDPSQLYLLTCVGLYLNKQEKDDLLLTMAYRSFVNRNYNEEMLLYLKNFFEGRVFDLLDLWNILEQTGLNDVDYEERVLKQIQFVGAKDDRKYALLDSYLKKRENRELAWTLMEEESADYVIDSLKPAGEVFLSDEYFTVLEHLTEGQNSKETDWPLLLQLAFLARKAESGWKDREKYQIAQLVKELCQKEIVFPFFEKFESFVSIPSLWKESVCFWFRGEGERTYFLNLQGTGEEFEIPVQELGKGCYYGTCFLPSFPSLTEAKVSGETYPVGMAMIGNGVEGSRSWILEQMDQEKEKAAGWMKDYERILERMDRQLQFLREQ